MEIIGEILLGLLQFVFELLLQVIFQMLVEAGVQGIAEVLVRRPPQDPWLAAIGYVLLGAICGALSLWLFPALFIRNKTIRALNLLLTPAAAGAMMAALGAWRRRRSQQLILLDRFSYGFLFALSMALVRFIWGH
jgi:hypothetical protein